MTTPFDSLPTELQASVLELRASGVGADFINEFTDRMLHALGVKSNKVQVEVWEMEERLGQQLTRIGDKLQIDLQTQHGATNSMLVELRQAQQMAHPKIGEALAGIADIKKNWSELVQWRSRIEAALAGLSEFRAQSTGDRLAIRDALNDLNTRHGGQIQGIIDRLTAIEQLLEIAGNHEAGS